MGYDWGISLGTRLSMGYDWGISLGTRLGV